MFIDTRSVQIDAPVLNTTANVPTFTSHVKVDVQVHVVTGNMRFYTSVVG